MSVMYEKYRKTRINSLIHVFFSLSDQLQFRALKVQSCGRHRHLLKAIPAAKAAMLHWYLRSRRQPPLPLSPQMVVHLLRCDKWTFLKEIKGTALTYLFVSRVRPACIHAMKHNGVFFQAKTDSSHPIAMLYGKRAFPFALSRS